MLRAEISDQMKQAMKDRDQVKLSALRFLWSEIRNAEIDAKVELDDEAVLAVISREVKKRKEAVDQMKSVGREELASEEEAKLAVMTEFLPEQMSREEIEVIVDDIVASGAGDFGAVMGQVMAKVKGKADGKLVGEVVKTKMASSK
jgi:uncharacterized protein YqeY